MYTINIVTESFSNIQLINPKYKILQNNKIDLPIIMSCVIYIDFIHIFISGI